MPAVHELLRDAAARLVAAGLPPADAATDVEVLARHVLGWDRAAFLARRRDPAPEGLEATLAPLVARRAAREPVAYITGHREFWGLDFLVGPAVLVPRPETELLVEAAIDELRAARGEGSALVVDVGTGSGCVAVALAHARPDTAVVAVDRSVDAARIARRNVLRHRLGGRVRVLAGDMLSAFPSSARAIDLIVSNPPYVPDGSPDVADDVRAFEPASALYSGPDGLCHIRRLIGGAGRVLRPGGALLFEIGAGQDAAVAGLLERHEGWVESTVRHDLRGIPRVVRVRRGTA